MSSTQIVKDISDNITPIINGLFLLLLAISGNFVAQTFSCSMRNLFSNNMIVKYILCLFIIYFSINYSTTENISPLINLGYSLIIWIVFIAFTRMSIFFTITVCILLIILCAINSVVEYYTELHNNKTLDEQVTYDLPSTSTSHTSEYYKYIINLFNTYRIIILSLIALAIFTGFGTYLYKKRLQHGSSFNWTTFIFGKLECSIK